MSLQFDIRSIEDIERETRRQARQDRRDAVRPILALPELDIGVSIAHLRED